MVKNTTKILVFRQPTQDAKKCIITCRISSHSRTYKTKKIGSFASEKYAGNTFFIICTSSCRTVHKPLLDVHTRPNTMDLFQLDSNVPFALILMHFYD
jgi:hypothetical protein